MTVSCKQTVSFHPLDRYENPAQGNIPSAPTNSSGICIKRYPRGVAVPQNSADALLCPIPTSSARSLAAAHLYCKLTRNSIPIQSSIKKKAMRTSMRPRNSAPNTRERRSGHIKGRPRRLTGLFPDWNTSSSWTAR